MHLVVLTEGAAQISVGKSLLLVVQEILSLPSTQVSAVCLLLLLARVQQLLELMPGVALVSVS